MDGLVQLDSAFFDIGCEELINAYELNVFIGKPFLQTKPGRIVGVASFG